jgi:hypothetical protein
LRNVAGYIRKYQTLNNINREELKIFNLNAKILKSRSQWKYHVHRVEDERIPKKTVTYSYNPKRRKKKSSMDQMGRACGTNGEEVECM